MFDDSKRLDKLEAQVAELTKAYVKTVDAAEQWTKRLDSFDTDITKRLDDAIKQINENDKAIDKHFSDLEKRLDADVKKLQQRCANLEATVKKLSK
jgi:septal ring factor EnvC (AmiA/AmiB activator)